MRGEVVKGSLTVDSILQAKSYLVPPPGRCGVVTSEIRSFTDTLTFEMVKVTVEILYRGSSSGDLLYLSKRVYEVAGEMGMAGFLGDHVGNVIKGIGFGGYFEFIIYEYLIGR